MRQTYVLDTSSLISDPTAYEHFAHSDVIIPIAVLNELDKLKKQSGEVGKNARVCIKLLDKIGDKGTINIGILLDNDVLLKIDPTHYDMSDPKFSGFGDPNYGDTQILACAYATWLEHEVKDVILISNDINLRIKAKSRGMEAYSHETNKFSFNDLYGGLKIIDAEDIGLSLQKNGAIDPSDYNIKMFMNECVCFTDSDQNNIALGRKVANDKIKLIKKSYPWNIAARNREQAFAIDLIMDKNIDLVTLIGLAGSGKSIIALAAALELVINRKEYDKLVIYRPIQAVGNDIGYMPGDMKEKLAPWFQAILDNLEILLSTKNGNRWKKDLEMFEEKGQISMEAITYIRGRSIPNSIILIDEAQNITKEDIKTILTRAGEGTKIILTGDISQIDNSSLDATNNGLTYVIDKFKDSELSGHITFTQGERSRLATMAADIL